jgi:predicted 3-demethylubiquinone-9 3-methyltransferase (glyoxalase superfamily)
MRLARGWLKDKFGLSWQIVPALLPDLLKHPKAVQAMLQMKKLDIAELERAAKS